MAFTKLLIANRGEIACRVLETARTLGYPTVAVFSDADADARHVEQADEAIHIGGAPAAESYLVIDKIIEACRRTGADAVHPGYGFLSENPAFARACEAHGIVFVGPSAEAIEVMGDKASAKARMQDAAVPLVPGFFSARSEDQAESVLVEKAQAIGFPLLVKAVAGGGGRGMRRVDAAGDMAAAIASARSEAESAFGDGTLMLEKLVTGARHIEVQVLADAHGNTVHLGERDCSLQRRHQKVIEESPSPFVDAELRAKMGAAAVAAAEAVNYRGAGTVEFLVDAEGNFYFLEMNTRLQVEHPVTEIVTDLDLVQLQLQVAAGEPLPFEQDDIVLAGHAIEVRLYAEDAHAGFMPQTGPVLAWQAAQAPGVRVDHGLREGHAVSAHYDPMVAKVIGFGRDRDEARRRTRGALRETVALGFVHNKRFLSDMLEHPSFAQGQVTTDFLDGLSPDEAPLRRPSAHPHAHAIAAALLAPHASGARLDTDIIGVAWRNAHPRPAHLDLQLGDARIACTVEAKEGHDAVGVAGEQAKQVRVVDTFGAVTRIDVDGHRFDVHAAIDADHTLHLEVDGLVATYAIAVATGKAQVAAGSDGKIKAPSSGKVLEVLVAVGDTVEAGAGLLKLEAMKIESTVATPVEGIVRELRVAPGDQVEQRALLILLEPTATDPVQS